MCSRAGARAVARLAEPRPAVPPSPGRDSQSSSAALALILVGACGVRIFLASRWSFFGDEVFSLRASLHGFTHAWRASGEDIHPPLYHLLLAAWLGVMGPWPEWRARLLSIAIGVCWPFLVHRIAREHLSRSGALVAATIVALHPFAVQFTVPLRWYGAFALLATLTTHLTERVLRWGRRRDLALLSVTLVGAGWTHIFGWVLGLGVFAVVAIAGLHRPRDPDRIGLREIALAALAVVAGWVPVFLLLGRRILEGVPGLDRTGIRSGLVLKPAFLILALLAGQASYPTDVLTLVALFVCFAALAAWAWRCRPHLSGGLGLVAQIPTLALVVFVVTDFSSPHYYLALLVPIALLAGRLSEQRDPAARIAVLAFGAAGVVGLAHLLLGVQYQREEFSDPWREVAEHARAAAGQEGWVLTTHSSPRFYMGDSTHSAEVVRPADLARAFAAMPVRTPQRIVAIIAPLSGALPELGAVARWLPDSLRARGYLAIRDTGMVRTDAPELRRRFSNRPFPEFRVRELDWVRR